MNKNLNLLFNEKTENIKIAKQKTYDSKPKRKRGR
jgi:hypothetical protein